MISNFNSQPLCTVGLKPERMMHLSILINGIVSYTEYAGLEIPVDSAIARWTLKTEMLVQNCTDAYGRKGHFRPSQVVWTSELNMMALPDVMGPNQIIFSLTVCTLIRPILTEWQRKVCFAPIDSNAKMGPALPIAICRENSNAMRELTGISRPA